jgi:hypothetical protein
MTPAEALLIFIIIVIIAFLIYYYFRGSSGHMALTRPMESRVDEYLDRRFEAMIDEWALMNRQKVLKWRDDKIKIVASDEQRVGALKDFEKNMSATLSNLEERIEALEEQNPAK